MKEILSIVAGISFFLGLVGFPGALLITIACIVIIVASSDDK
jgi:hypothetical protein